MLTILCALAVFVQAQREPFSELIPGTTVSLKLAPVVGPSSASGNQAGDVAPFWIATTETTWEMYDAFVFAMDRKQGETDPPDAYTRPSKPYILMDRGYGHAGYPVISVSFRGAKEFCTWLSHKTGRKYRLPSEVEWELACRGGASTSDSELGTLAWFADNSDSKTHPPAQKKPNAFGLYDMQGNAAEWCVGADGLGVARGGSFKDPREQVAPTARVPNSPTLNARDPQVPKSKWWLADGGFIGFRVVCESPTAAK